MPCAFVRADEETSRALLKECDGRVILGSEGVLGHVDRHRIRVGDAVRADAGANRRHLRERPDRLTEDDELREFVPDVPGLGDAVHLRNGRRRADHRVQERQLVGDGREPVVLDERERELPCQPRFATQEHPLPGDEDVIEDGEGLEHLRLRGERELERVLFSG